MPDKAWKRDERRIADLIGGHRVPINGRGKQSDVRHSMFSVEVKHTERRWSLLDEAMEQAAEAATIEGKIPMVVIHYSDTQTSRSAYVVFRMPGFQKLLEDATQLPPSIQAALNSGDGS
jgi:hypothetical protein